MNESGPRKPQTYETSCGCLLIQFARHKGIHEGYAAFESVTGEDGQLIPTTPTEGYEVGTLIHRATNCQVAKYSEVLHLL